MFVTTAAVTGRERMSPSGLVADVFVMWDSPVVVV